MDQNSQEYLDKAMNLHYQGKHSESHQYFSRCILIDPRNSEAYFNWGNALEAVGNDEEAIRKYSFAVSINPKYTEAFNNLGYTYEKIGMNRRAIIPLEKAVAIDSTYSNAYFIWGRALNGLRRYEEAIEKYTLCVQYDKKNGQAYKNMGYAHYMLRRYDEAIEDYKKAKKYIPKDGQLYANWGAALQCQNKFKEAITQYKAGIKVRPNFIVTYNNWGWLLAKDLCNYQDAVKKFEICLGLDPGFYWRHYCLGYGLYKLGKYKKAIKEFKETVGLDPENNDAYKDWGNSLYQLDKYKEAIQKYKKAVQINPRDSKAYRGWGDALYQLGRRQEALYKYSMAETLEEERGHPRYKPIKKNKPSTLMEIEYDLNPEEHLSLEVERYTMFLKTHLIQLISRTFFFQKEQLQAKNPDLPLVYKLTKGSFSLIQKLPNATNIFPSVSKMPKTTNKQSKGKKPKITTYRSLFSHFSDFNEIKKVINAVSTDLAGRRRSYLKASLGQLLDKEYRKKVKTLKQVLETGGLKSKGEELALLDLEILVVFCFFEEIQISPYAQGDKLKSIAKPLLEKMKEYFKEMESIGRTHLYDFGP